MRKHIHIYLISMLMVLFVAFPAAAITIDEEIQLGKEANESILKEDKLLSDESAQKEMRQLGNDLAQFVKRKQIKYTFQILDMEDEKNAFAVPGGYVYYTSGLWKILTPDERAGVLAHEIIHVDQRHSLDAMIKHQRRRTWTDLALILAGANQTIQQVAGMVNTLHELKYSRGDERQADEMGVQLLVRAKKNPAGLLMAMRKIMRMEEQSGGAPPKIFSSHPPSKERLAYLEKMLVDMKASVPNDPIKESKDSNQIGKVTSINRDTVKFTSTKPLEIGDVVWITAPGWDSRYENRSAIPFARGKVTAKNETYTAAIKLLSDGDIPGDKASMGISQASVDKLQGVVGTIADGKVSTKTAMNPGTRLLAWQVVWNSSKNDYVNDIIGYIVLRDSDPVVVQRKIYAYAPIKEFSYLKTVSDNDEERWAAAVASVGRVDKRVEAVPGDQIKDGVAYEIRTPVWEKERKVIAKAKAAVLGKKVTLDVYDFAEGWSIDRISPGFEIYRQAVAK